MWPRILSVRVVPITTMREAMMFLDGTRVRVYLPGSIYHGVLGEVQTVDRSSLMTTYTIALRDNSRLLISPDNLRRCDDPIFKSTTAKA